MRVSAVLLLLSSAACGGPSDSRVDSAEDGTTATEDTATVSTGDDDMDTGVSSGESESGVPEDLSDEGPARCDPFAARDCQGSDKCVPHDDDRDREWDTWRCGSGGSDAQLEACSAGQDPQGTGRSDTCEAGLACSDFGGPDSEVGWCAKLCDDTHPCEPGASCLPAPEGFFSWCRPVCNPLEPVNPCPGPGLACSFGLAAQFVCNQTITVEGQQGDACVLPTQCAFGLACLSGAVVGPSACGAHAACCTSLCDATSPACPAQAPTCTPLFGDGAEPGFESLGFCGD